MQIQSTTNYNPKFGNIYQIIGVHEHSLQAALKKAGAQYERDFVTLYGEDGLYALTGNDSIQSIPGKYAGDNFRQQIIQVINGSRQRIRQFFVENNPEGSADFHFEFTLHPIGNGGKQEIEIKHRTPRADDPRMGDYGDRLLKPVGEVDYHL